MMFRAVARKKLQPRRTHGPLYEISRMKSSNIISLIKKIKIDSMRRVPGFASYWLRRCDDEFIDRQTSWT